LKISNLVGSAKYYLILKDYFLVYSQNPANHESNNITTIMGQQLSPVRDYQMQLK